MILSKCTAEGNFVPQSRLFCGNCPPSAFSRKSLAKSFTGYHTLSGSPKVPRDHYAPARSLRLCLRHGTMQTFLMAWFLFLRKRLSFGTLAAVGLTREWSFSRFRKLPVCAPARRKVCSDYWIRINLKSKHTNTLPPAERSGKFHFRVVLAVWNGYLRICCHLRRHPNSNGHKIQAMPGLASHPGTART